MPAIQPLKLQRVLQSQTLRIREKGQTLSEKKETNIKDKSKGKSKGIAHRLDTL